MRHFCVRAVSACASVALLSGSASADFGQTVFSIKIGVLDPLGRVIQSDSWVYERGTGGFGPESETAAGYDWTLDHGVVFTFPGMSGHVMLQEASASLQENPVAATGFKVENTLPVATQIMITSSLMSFPGLVNPSSRAESSVEVAGLLLRSTTLEPAGGKGFGAYYNGSAPGSGTLFTAHHSTELESPGFLDPVSEHMLTPGPSVADHVQISDKVESISVQFTLELGPLSVASGDGLFEVLVPSAPTVPIAAFVFVAIRRRR